MQVDAEELQSLYEWVDEIPLSRPKRNIARDFSDGVLAAEILKSFYPRLVDLHNYSPASGLAQKLYNWSTLNTKVFRKLGFIVRHQECEAVASCEPGAIERVLKLLYTRLPPLDPEAPAIPATLTFDKAGHEDEEEDAASDEEAIQPSGYASRSRDSPAAWGEQAALLRIEEQEFTIEDLRGANQALENQAEMLQADLEERDAHIESLTASLEALKAKLVEQAQAAPVSAPKSKNCNVIRPARPLAERTPNSSTQVHAATRRMKPPPGLTRLEF